MRAGAYTIHQSLTAEAAAVLKLALGLARRRGHAQVTPLHVAFALLTSGGGGPTAAQPASGLGGSSSSYGLLKRACLRSLPGGAAAAAAAAHHPLQCRALELCFNVALNRLPTSMSQSQSHSPPPPMNMMGGSSFASSMMIQPSPTLSNALVAALKRAQANQRRGCVELHHTPPSATSSSTQQQQPALLAIKVELDQLLISILDDPSVSRVMREAGFSSSQVKTNLEEESALMPPPHSSSSTSPPPPAQPTSIPPHFFHDHPSVNNNGGFGPWPAPAHQFLAATSSLCKVVDDDVRPVLDVMVRRRSNPVVVGDSATMAEAVADELLRRLERGGEDVPEALAGAHLLRLQLSYVHVRLMTRADVDARAAELRRGLDAAQLRHHHHRGGGGGLVVFVGDLRWAIHDDDPAHHDGPAAYSPVDHMVAELGRLVDDLRASRGRAWLVATASYQTYMRWQQRRRRRPTEPAWALQAVLVPTGGGTGLALNNLHHQQSATAAAGAQPAMLTMQYQAGQRSPFTTAPNVFGAERDVQQEAEKLVLCAECNKNYEREASLVKAETADAEGPHASLPGWLVPDRTPPPADQERHKDKYLVDLKRKWSRLCRKLHLCVDPPCSASPSPRAWWSGPCMPPPSRPSMAGLLGLDGLMMAAHGKSSWTSDWPARCGGLASLREPDVGTALALGNLQPLSDTASSDGGRAPGCDDGSSVRELERRLRRNIPWQPANVAAKIAEAVIIAGGEGGNEEKGNAGVAWLYVKGSDHAAVRRAAAVIAEAADRVVVCVDAGRFGRAEELCADVASKVGGGRKKIVLVFRDVEGAAEDVVECLVAASRSGCFTDRPSGGHELDLGGSVVILTTAKLATGGADDDVISLRLWSEEDGGDRKRKPNTEPSSPIAERKKRPRHDLDTTSLDLNIDLCADDDDDDSNTSPDEEDEEEEAVPSDITHEGSSVDDHPPRSLLGTAAEVVNLDDDGRAIRDHLRARLAGALGAGEHQSPTKGGGAGRGRGCGGAGRGVGALPRGDHGEVGGGGAPTCGGGGNGGREKREQKARRGTRHQNE
ncbi:hypothetical protein PR202_gb15966 [Eleusine coracana subsp. coracana]|uniref:Clp R domain-containing protein n=1 Tax=Eleusine coracana subsp. coracana TaxID=191504 RepID=A0AAV5EZ97_ELECO|nr:hypothetical protein PR202_gb15966 [Eleusine coracana subsp. coracana]